MNKNLVLAVLALFFIGFWMGISYNLTIFLSKISETPTNFSVEARYFGNNSVYIVIRNTGNAAINLKNLGVYAQGIALPITSLIPDMLWVGNSSLIIASNASYGDVCGGFITVTTKEIPKNMSSLVLC